MRRKNGYPFFSTYIRHPVPDDAEIHHSGAPATELPERVRFSVIKLAMQRPEMFKVAVELLHIDTRDILVTVEFADDLMAHEKWYQ